VIPYGKWHSVAVSWSFSINGLQYLYLFFTFFASPHCRITSLRASKVGFIAHLISTSRMYNRPGTGGRCCLGAGHMSAMYALTRRQHFSAWNDVMAAIWKLCRHFYVVWYVFIWFLFFLSLSSNFYRAMHYSAKRSIAIACRLYTVGQKTGPLCYLASNFRDTAQRYCSDLQDVFYRNQSRFILNRNT